MTTRTLYLCYFGLREPLVQTQVLPYLRLLSREQIEVSLLTFEADRHRTWPQEQEKEWRDRLSSQGITWLALPYHKRPSLAATLFDIAEGARAASKLIRRNGIHIIHCRGHVAAAMGLMAKRRSGGQILFDIRGFMPEEYVDAGTWHRSGLCYRLTKRAETKLMASADGFVILTERARAILFPGCSDTDPSGRPIEVIPCCVDLERFESAGPACRLSVRRELGLEGRRVLVYAGGLGGWYLTESMIDFLATARQRDPSVFSLILTQSPPELVLRGLKRRGLAESDYLVRRVAPEEMPRYLQAADFGMSFIKPSYSKLASSPTKLAEYLASGLPVICNAGIGDVDAVIETDHVGILVREFSPDGYARALAAAGELARDASLAARCRACAHERFHLGKVGGLRYRRLYQRMVQSGATPGTACEALR
jgi:glycosyltransferase involved in cell wall biosynthesis